MASFSKSRRNFGSCKGLCSEGGGENSGTLVEASVTGTTLPLLVEGVATEADEDQGKAKEHSAEEEAGDVRELGAVPVAGAEGLPLTKAAEASASIVRATLLIFTPSRHAQRGAGGRGCALTGEKAEVVTFGIGLAPVAAILIFALIALIDVRARWRKRSHQRRKEARERRKKKPTALGMNHAGGELGGHICGVKASPLAVAPGTN